MFVVDIRNSSDDRARQPLEAWWQEDVESRLDSARSSQSWSHSPDHEGDKYAAPSLTLAIVVALLLAAASLPAFAAAKVDVYHIPPGNPLGWHTLSVSSNALAAHLAHGDLEGSCAESCEALCDDADACTQDIETCLFAVP